MCRLLGISMGGAAEDIDCGQIAALMFKALTAGGPHAFGWMNYKAGDDVVNYQSRPGRADSLENLEFIYTSVEQQPSWFVGHTRWATHGDPKNNANNHPILHGDVLGVHNGVLRNHEDILKETGRQDATSEVDSEAIFAAVNKWGAMPGIRKVEGDMVAIWNDLNDFETLYIARSEGRFLHLGWTDRGNLVFASQPSAIEALHPLVRITKWSTVDMHKMLTIKAGKIIKREKIREVAPKPVVVAKPVTGASAQTDRFSKEFFDAQGISAQKRGSRRGEAMFPKNTVQESMEPKGDDKVVANVHTLAPVLKTQPAPKDEVPAKSKKKKAPKVDRHERWVPALGMFADENDALRPATQAEADFFGWDNAADQQLLDNMTPAEQEEVLRALDEQDEADWDRQTGGDWEGEGNPLTETA